MLLIKVGHNDSPYSGVTKPDESENHPQIVACAAEYGIYGITQEALEPIASQLAIILHVANRRFNGTSPTNRLADGRGNSPFLSASPDRHSVNADAAIAFVDKHGLGHPSVKMLTCSMASGKV